MKKSLIYLFYVLAAIAAACSTTASYDSAGGLGDGGGAGKGGSMARFAIKDSCLYVVDQLTLKTFDIHIPEKPVYLQGKDLILEQGIETIFPVDTLLFIGSRNGMYIFDVKRPLFPTRLAMVSHITSCDPVVAAGNYAYVTLNSTSKWCGTQANIMIVYDISDPRSPREIRQLNLNSPRGLGIDGSKLFVCDNGLKVYDITTPDDPVWVDDLSFKDDAVSNIQTYDVIPINGILLVIGSDGFYQFDYNGDALKLISKITVTGKEDNDEEQDN
ncbi:MAG: hypothetical protein LBR06_05400 [Bacteroidales bacterium]|jgi:hypothetical protein|nr:hypothetical protein [Bacteroidales bacterium]